MDEYWIVPQAPSEAAKWAELSLLPSSQAFHLLEGTPYIVRLLSGLFLGQVKNLHLTAILTRDNADVYNPCKPLDKCTVSILPALNPKCWGRNHSLCNTLSSSRDLLHV